MHSTLLGCNKFRKYLPDKLNGSNSQPMEICRLCLGTIFRNCRHSNLTDYKKYCCKKSDISFLRCHKCKRHENAQEWMRANHKPEKGWGNLYAMYNSLGTEHVQVNSVTIEPETQMEQEIKMRDIGKLDQDEEIVTSVRVNTIPKKRACPPYEVI